MPCPPRMAGESATATRSRSSTVTARGVQVCRPARRLVWCLRCTSRDRSSPAGSEGGSSSGAWSWFLSARSRFRSACGLTEVSSAIAWVSSAWVFRRLCGSLGKPRPLVQAGASARPIRRAALAELRLSRWGSWRRWQRWSSSVGSPVLDRSQGRVAAPSVRSRCSPMMSSAGRAVGSFDALGAATCERRSTARARNAVALSRGRFNASSCLTND